MRNSRQSNSWRFAVRPAETQTLLGICRGHIKQQASEGERQICDEAKAKTGLHRTLIQRRVRRLFETASRRQSGPKTTWCVASAGPSPAPHQHRRRWRAPGVIRQVVTSEGGCKRECGGRETTFTHRSGSRGMLCGRGKNSRQHLLSHSLACLQRHALGRQQCAMCPHRADRDVATAQLSWLLSARTSAERGTPCPLLARSILAEQL